MGIAFDGLTEFFFGKEVDFSTAFELARQAAQYWCGEQDVTNRAEANNQDAGGHRENFGQFIPSSPTAGTKPRRSTARVGWAMIGSGYFWPMYLVDTHAHLYLPQFDEDRTLVLDRASAAGVARVLLPNIDLGSIGPMLALCDARPDLCYPMMGLHPCDVKPGYADVLVEMKARLSARRYLAIGETGIDLYWDKTTLPMQVEAFREQVHWAIEYALPVVIHARESFDELFAVLDEENGPGLRGVFHCFTGTRAQAEKILGYGGFMLGLGGVLTYPKAALDQVVADLPRESILLETDAPFLPPVPHRGKRNESAYVAQVALRLSSIWQVGVQEVARITSGNAFRMFFPDESPPE